VTLGITCADVDCPASNAPRIDGFPVARHDRTDVTEADRDEVIEALKQAYVRDELTTDQLGDRVAVAHLAETLDELDKALADVDIA
jgi:uncharacterized protein DUF1707